MNLEPSASNRGYDGRFTAGPLQGRTVNIKWYSSSKACSISVPMRFRTTTWSSLARPLPPRRLGQGPAMVD